MRACTAVIIITAAISLSGCAGLDAALQYNGTTVMPYMNMADTWRIFDKPVEGRLMITPSLGRSAGDGALRGLTLGIADTDIPKPEYQQAVEGWLISSGRMCSVTDGYKLIRPQWEFKYSCK